jgi:hypothetical protein
MSADLAGFRRVEVDVESERVLVVLVGAGEVTEGAEGVAEASVGAGLLVGCADGDGDGVGGGVVGESVDGTTGGAGRFAETVERNGLAVSFAPVQEDGQGLWMVARGPGVLTTTCV